MILFSEYHCIMTFRLIIGRIAIKKGTIPVILPNQCLKVFIFYYGICQPAGCLPNGVKAVPHIKRTAAKGRAATSIAVPN